MLSISVLPRMRPLRMLSKYLSYRPRSYGRCILHFTLELERPKNGPWHDRSKRLHSLIAKPGVAARGLAGTSQLMLSTHPSFPRLSLILAFDLQ